MKPTRDVSFAAAVVVAVFGGVVPQASAKSSTSTTKTSVDPNVLAALDNMGAFLRAQKTFTVDAETATDEILGNGEKVKRDGAAHLKVDRPGRLRADISGDEKDQQIYFDGKTFTIFQPETGYYADFAAPPTLAEMVEVAEKRYGIDLPLADLFYWGADKTKALALQSAINAGTSVVKGVTCDHFAFRQPGVDWQIWIQRGDKPLPSKLIVTTTSSSVRPEHEVLLSWNLNPNINNQAFVFTPPAGAQKIQLDTIGPLRVGLPRQGRASTARGERATTAATKGATP
jgi:hypothetical protein